MLLYHTSCVSISVCLVFFFFNDTATTEIYTLSLHDALPIFARRRPALGVRLEGRTGNIPSSGRSEEHTSELQSLRHLVCRLLLEKKKNKKQNSRDATIQQDIKIPREQQIHKIINTERYIATP